MKHEDMELDNERAVARIAEALRLAKPSAELSTDTDPEYLTQRQIGWESAVNALDEAFPRWGISQRVFGVGAELAERERGDEGGHVLVTIKSTKLNSLGRPINMFSVDLGSRGDGSDEEVDSFVRDLCQKVLGDEFFGGYEVSWSTIKREDGHD